MKKYINRNFFWADLFIAQLSKLGVKHVCISPGSRNTPITIAFAQNKSFKKYVHVDERSSGFFALGIAKQNKRPVAIVTTSGTAVAELYPSIIEAFIQRVPLIICTADRPEYLRNTGANQTINQNNIFANHIRTFVDFGLPTLNSKKLQSFCNKIVDASKIGFESDPGPIHFNFPFKKPLEPNTYSENINHKIKDYLIEISNYESISFKKKDIIKIVNQLEASIKPLIHIGWNEFNTKFYKKLVGFSEKNNIPILVDGTSNLRYFKGRNNTIITNHSSFLTYLEDEPDLIIQFGNAPTSQSVLKYFEKTKAKRILINEFGDIKDPSKRKGDLVIWDPLALLEEIYSHEYNRGDWNNWMKYIARKESICEAQKDIIINAPYGNEPRIINEILSVIPSNSNLFISNSLPIRDFDYFASKMKTNLKVFTNRGASGIDGIISTASGIASQSNNHTYLIIGDLSFYHNISALSTLHEMKIPLKIILVNNNGGGIFNMLPVSDNSQNFIKYFTTSQNLDFKKIVTAFGGKYYLTKSWNSFRKNMTNSAATILFSVIEIKSDTPKSVSLRKKYWKNVREQLILRNDS